MLLVRATYDIFSEQRILQLKEEHPEAEIIAHPECQEAILRHAAFVGSTTGLIKRVVELRPDPGSLKPMCPVLPMPKICKSIPPCSSIFLSYSLQYF